VLKSFIALSIIDMIDILGCNIDEILTSVTKSKGFVMLLRQ